MTTNVETSSRFSLRTFILGLVWLLIGEQALFFLFRTGSATPGYGSINHVEEAAMEDAPRILNKNTNSSNANSIGSGSSSVTSFIESQNHSSAEQLTKTTRNATKALSFDPDNANDNETTSTLTLLLSSPCDWIGDIDISKGSYLGCGIVKCAFRSKSSGDSLGYLLASSTSSDNDFHGHKTWAYAKELASKYGIQHTYMGPSHVQQHKDDKESKCPENINSHHNHGPLGKGMANQLNEAGPIVNKSTKIFKRRHYLVVQPISILPPQSIIFKCHSFYYKKAKQKLNKVTARFDSRTSFEAWESKLRSDLANLCKLLDSKKGRCLNYDFQVAIDPHTGDFLHLDLDRCDDNRAPVGNKTEFERLRKECYPKLNKFVDNLIDNRRPKPSSNATTLDNASTTTRR